MYASRFMRRFALNFHKVNSTARLDRGFTLIELLLVIAVLGILTAVVIFSLGGVNTQAAVTACQADSKSVQVAVASFESNSGGSPPTTLDQLTQGPKPYLQSLPSSPYYAISLQNGVVMVAAPSSAAPVGASTLNACSQAGASDGATTTSQPESTTTTTPSTTTTIPDATTTTTTVPATTTTTVPPTTTTSTTTTTTTTTLPPSNGVTASGTYSSSGKKGTEVLTISNHTLTTLSIAIEVAPGAGEKVAYSSEKTSFTSRDFTDSETSVAGDVTYTFVLKAGDTVNANTNGTATAVFTTNVTTHDGAEDLWVVTDTSNGDYGTLSGNF